MMTEEKRELIDFINQEIDKWDDERRYVRVLEIALAALTQPASPALNLPGDARQALNLALQAMEFMGDTLNNLDAVCPEDVEFVTPAFNAVRSILADAAPAAPHTAPIEPICATGGAEWVKVSDKMPLELSDEHISAVEVIVTDGTTVGTCEYRRGYLPRPWAEWSNYGDIDADKITHWQPMPSVPDA